MRPGTLNRLHDSHQGLTSTLQRARRTVHWPRLQDDITETVQKCKPCQRHGNKKPANPERQLTATRLGMDSAYFKGKHTLVTVDYFSGFITYDNLYSYVMKQVTR